MTSYHRAREKAFSLALCQLPLTTDDTHFSARINIVKFIYNIAILNINGFNLHKCVMYSIMNNNFDYNNKK